MTLEQRRELERLIDDARYAMLILGQTPSTTAQRQANDTCVALRAFLDAITDYSREDGEPECLTSTTR